MFAKSPESFALAPEPELEWDATMDVRGLTRDRHLLGADYSLPDGARGGPAADAPLLRGRVDTRELSPGLVLYRTAVQDLCSMQTTNLLHPGIKLCVLVSGRSELAYGHRHFDLGPGRAQGQAVLVSLAEADRFTRRWHAGRSERKITITLRSEWLARAGLQSRGIERFCHQHLALGGWAPSPRALAIAQQLSSPPPLVEGLQRLWLESRCLDLIVEALSCVAQEERHAARGPVPEGLDARNYRRLRALCDFLDSGEADAMTLPDIARHAGMSASHLQRHFPKVGQMPVMEYMRARRLEKARLALERGEVGISGAAALAGYRSEANFATAIRRRYGLTPSDLRKYF